MAFTSEWDEVKFTSASLRMSVSWFGGDDIIVVSPLHGVEHVEWDGKTSPSLADIEGFACRTFNDMRDQIRIKPKEITR